MELNPRRGVRFHFSDAGHTITFEKFSDYKAPCVYVDGREVEFTVDVTEQDWLSFRIDDHEYLIVSTFNSGVLWGTVPGFRKRPGMCCLLKDEREIAKYSIGPRQYTGLTVVRVAMVGGATVIAVVWALVGEFPFSKYLISLLYLGLVVYLMFEFRNDLQCFEEAPDTEPQIRDQLLAEWRKLQRERFTHDGPEDLPGPQAADTPHDRLLRKVRRERRFSLGASILIIVAACLCRMEDLLMLVAASVYICIRRFRCMNPVVIMVSGFWFIAVGLRVVESLITQEGSVDRNPGFIVAIAVSYFAVWHVVTFLKNGKGTPNKMRISPDSSS